MQLLLYNLNLFQSGADLTMENDNGIKLGYNWDEATLTYRRLVSTIVFSSIMNESLLKHHKTCKCFVLS